MNTLGQFLDKVLIVLVIYRQTLSTSAAWKSLYSNLSTLPWEPKVLVYDNSPQPQAFDSALVTYQHDPGNPGVSKAYNYAAELARCSDSDWMILFDQDTEINKTTFEIYHQSLLAHPGEVLFAPVLVDKRGIVSPFVFRFGGGHRLRTTPRGPLAIDKCKVINSGLMIRLSAFRSVGGYDEGLPLDFSDVAFISRMRKLTNTIIITADQLNHEFSDTVSHSTAEAAERFGVYVRGAKRFANGHGSRLIMLFRTFFRALRLSIRYTDSSFISVYYSAWRS